MKLDNYDYKKNKLKTSPPSSKHSTTTTPHSTVLCSVLAQEFGFKADMMLSWLQTQEGKIASAAPISLKKHEVEKVCTGSYDPTDSDIQLKLGARDFMDPIKFQFIDSISFFANLE